MSSTPFTAAANVETPSNVNVPPGWPAFIVWMISHLGPALVLAIAMCAVCLYGVNKVYGDMQAINAQLLLAFNARTTVEVEHVSLLKSMQSTLSRIDDKLDRDSRQKPANIPQ